MEPPALFRSLQVCELLTDTDKAYFLDAQRAAIARGQPYAFDVLQDMTLWLALLRTAPFRDCPATHLRDLRYGSTPVQWPGRRRLFWRLCRELIVFETGHVEAALADSMQACDRGCREQALLEGKIAYLDYAMQRCKAARASTPAAGYTLDLAAFDRVRRLLTRGVTKAQKPPKVSGLARSLVSVMQTLAPHDYRHEAMRFAVAAMLQGFGLMDPRIPLYTAAGRVYEAVRPPRPRRRRQRR